MRHHNTNRKFGRERKGRRALVKSLTRSLVLSGRIRTTLAKAKEIRPIVEKLVTRSRTPGLASQRLLIAKTSDQEVVKKLISDIGPKYKDRTGGYLRIMKVGNRSSDGSPMAMIEFV